MKEMAVNGITLNSVKKGLEFERVDVTVGIPLGQAEKGSWLALEGLCRQVLEKSEVNSQVRNLITKKASGKKRRISFEVIVLEDGRAGFDQLCYRKVNNYQARLYEAGCRSLRYFTLPEPLSLLDKIQKLVGLAKGEIFLLQWADAYPQPYRIQETFELLKEKQWCRSKREFIVNVRNRRFRVLDWDQIKADGCCWYGCNVAFKIATARELLAELKNNSVSCDWIGRLVTESPGEWNESEYWQQGFSCYNEYCTVPFQQLLKAANGVKVAGDIWRRVG